MRPAPTTVVRARLSAPCSRTYGALANTLSSSRPPAEKPYPAGVEKKVAAHEHERLDSPPSALTAKPGELGVYLLRPHRMRPLVVNVNAVASENLVESCSGLTSRSLSTYA
jgi:hypothetical protein